MSDFFISACIEKLIIAMLTVFIKFLYIIVFARTTLTDSAYWRQMPELIIKYYEIVLCPSRDD